MDDELTPVEAGSGSGPEQIPAPGVKVNKDGSVRRKPGPKPGAKRKAPAPGPRPATTAPRKASSAPDYRASLVGLMQLPQLALAAVSRAIKDEKTKRMVQLDGITVGLHAPNIADALNRTAQTEPKLARILDRLATVGPYSLVATALLTPTIQILANHGMVAPNEQMGIYGGDDLAAMAAAQLG